jgi:hypothetical protein
VELEEGLRLVRAFGSAERWLAVLVTVRPDGRPSVSLVNAGILPHPVDGSVTGSHPDLAEYDRVMAAERRAAVFVRPRRFSTNPRGAEHEEAS